MDPQAALNDLLEALEKRDWDQVDEKANALLDWMDRGGFPPDTLGGRKLGKSWHVTMTTFICHCAISRLQDARKKKRERP